MDPFDIREAQDLVDEMLLARNGACVDCAGPLDDVGDCIKRGCPQLADDGPPLREAVNALGFAATLALLVLLLGGCNVPRQCPPTPAPPAADAGPTCVVPFAVRQYCRARFESDCLERYCAGQCHGDTECSTFFGGEY